MARLARSAASILTMALLLMGSKAQASIIPPIGLAPGSEYQLIFVTQGTIKATSSQESTYNTFVTTQAALNTNLPSATWTAITSVTGTAASSNAPYLSLRLQYAGIVGGRRKFWRIVLRL